MGDMADYYLEQAWDQDPFGDDEPDPPAFKTCRYCGKTGFYWASYEGNWRLRDSNGVHRCEVKPLPEKPKPREITDPVEKAFRAGFDLGYQSAMDEAHPGIGPGPMGGSLDDAWREYREG